MIYTVIRNQHMIIHMILTMEYGICITHDPTANEARRKKNERKGNKKALVAWNQLSNDPVTIEIDCSYSFPFRLLNAVA